MLSGRTSDGRASDASGGDTGTPDGYWRCWLEALGAVTAVSGDVTSAALAERAHEFAHRAPGHDHDHPHDHDHHHDH